MSKKSNQVPVKEGYGQSAGEGSSSPQSNKSEQDGQNKLLKESEFNDRERMAGNE